MRTNPNKNPRSQGTQLTQLTLPCAHCDAPPFHDRRGIACHYRIKHPGHPVPAEPDFPQQSTQESPRETLEVHQPAPSPSVPVAGYEEIESGMLCSRCHQRDFVFKRPLPDLCDPCRAFYVSEESILAWKPR